MRLRTRFTEALGITIPVMNGPMAGVAGGDLAAAVARAGGLGFIAAGHARNLEFIDRQVEIFYAKTADLE
jgi:NAD(P)H-dependent flavin oxidoreductase YrpB (nitropropane dioxygenase family)